MGIFKKFSSLFSSGTKSGDTLWLAVKCKRCGEIIRARVNLNNDLSPNYEEGQTDPTYFCRKVIIGDQGCFQRIEVELSFDAHRQIIERKITGGYFVDSQEISD
jgi:hypothetical protein